MTSVARKSHMPSEAVSRCCCAVAKWCNSAGSLCSACSTAAVLSLKRYLLRHRDLVVVVSFPSNFWGFVKIKSGGRRLRRPLQTRSSPRIVTCRFAVSQRPQQINHGQNITYGKYRRASCREDIQHLELRWILPIAARHAQITKNKLREECEIKSYENDQRRKTAPSLWIHASSNLGPPEMQAAKISHERAPDHDVVEVGDDKIRIMHMNIDPESSKE